MKCCNEKRKFIEKINENQLSGGHGEMGYFSVSIDEDGISFDNGWEDYPYLPFSFCPFCGAKQENEEE